MKMKDYFRSGDAWVWVNAGAVTLCLMMILGMLTLLAVKGLSHFWPKAIMQATYVADAANPQPVVGEIADTKSDPVARLLESGQPAPPGIDPLAKVERWSIKQGNKDITGQDFQWVTVPFLKDIRYPADLMMIERTTGGNLYGRLQSVTLNGQVITGNAAQASLQQAIDRVDELRTQAHDLEKGDIASVNYKMEQLRLDERKLQLKNKLDATAQAEIAERRSELENQFNAQNTKLQAINDSMDRDKAVFMIADGSTHDVSVHDMMYATAPNAMGIGAKVSQFFTNFWHFLSEDPREANTEGGVFPAIFGTITMVFIMTVLVTPLGVIAAIYLREYASQGRFTQMVRIAVNNLAGVPSIVYGVFGLGFFIYVLGGRIDQLFYPESLPQPVFGTPGLMWASITLALLTLPVVIVSTEEGLSRIPRSLREGSLALGATKVETLWRVILPMAMPSILTGVILAIARAAGEVAPLMLVGVVKLAPDLPVDLNAPFVHLDRKFMHLGFHIYDVGFQSPNVEAARPLVYATAFLLVLLVALLNLAAIALRNRLRERFKALET